jgi:hypothetical protein
MTAILVDSNVLLDLMTQDTQWFAWSANALASAANRFPLVVNPIIYAEVRFGIRASKNSTTPYRNTCSIGKHCLTRQHSWLGKSFSSTAGAVGQNSRRFPISSSARTRPSRDIGF